MKYKIIIIAITFLICLTAGMYFINRLKDESSVVLKLEFEKDRYLLSEKIWIKITLTNNSASAYYLKGDFNAFDIKFDVRDPDGVRLYSNRQIDVFVFDSTSVLPGEEFVNIFPIDNYINEDNEKTGQYTLTAKFQNIISNTDEIELESPEGDEEIQYTKYSKLFSPKKNVNDNDQRSDVEKALEFLSRYPGSVYSPDLYDKLLLKLLMSGKTTDVGKITEKFFSENADTYTSKSILKNYLIFLGEGKKQSLEAINEMLFNLQSKYKNTKTDYIINRFYR